MHVSLGSISPRDIAHQFVLQDTIGFNRIQVDELKGGKFTKDDKKETAPNVVAFIAQFNEMTMFAIHAILAKLDIRQRVAEVEYFVTVAQTCRELYDFNAVKAVLGALQSAPIYRLRSTWAGINKTVQKQYDEMCVLMGEDNNFTALREAYSNARAHVSGTITHTQTLTDTNTSPTYAPDVATTTPMSLCVSMGMSIQENVLPNKGSSSKLSAQTDTHAHTLSQPYTQSQAHTRTHTHTRAPIPSTMVTPSIGNISADVAICTGRCTKNSSTMNKRNSTPAASASPTTTTTPTSPMRSCSPNGSRSGSPTHTQTHISKHSPSRGRASSPTYTPAHSQRERRRLRGSSSSGTSTTRMESVSKSPVRGSSGGAGEWSTGGGDMGYGEGGSSRGSHMGYLEYPEEDTERRSLLHTLTHLNTIDSVGCESGSVGGCHVNDGLGTGTPTPTMTPVLTPTRPLSVNMNASASVEVDLCIPTHIHTRADTNTPPPPTDVETHTQTHEASLGVSDAGATDERPASSTVAHTPNDDTDNAPESLMGGGKGIVTGDSEDVSACAEPPSKGRSRTKAGPDTLVPRAIPFLGMFLTDLIYADVALADNKEERDKQTIEIIERSGVGAQVVEKEARMRARAQAARLTQANSTDIGDVLGASKSEEVGVHEAECTIYEAMHTHGTSVYSSTTTSLCTVGTNSIDSLCTGMGLGVDIGTGVGGVDKPSRQDFSMSMDDTLLDSNASGASHHKYSGVHANSTYSRGASASTDALGVALGEHRKSIRTHSDVPSRKREGVSHALEAFNDSLGDSLVYGHEGKSRAAKTDTKLNIPTTRVRAWSNGIWYKAKEPSWEAVNAQPRTRTPVSEKKDLGAQTGANSSRPTARVKQGGRKATSSAHLRPIVGLSSYMQGLSRFTVLMDEREAYNLSLRCEPKADRTHRPEQQWKVIDPKLFDTDSLHGSTPDTILKALNIFDERLDRLHMRLQSYKTMNDAPDSSSRDCLVPLPPGPTAVTITDDNENLWSFQLHITQLRRMYKQAIAAQKITAPASPNTPKASQTVVGEQADDTEEKITSLATDPCCHDNDGRAGGERHTLALRPCGSIDSTSMPALPSNRMANGIDKKRESFTSNASTIGPTTDNPSTTREGRPPRPSSIDLNKHRADKTAEYSDEVPASPKTRNKRGWHAFFGRSKKQGHKNSVPGTTSQQMSQLSLATSIQPETKNTPDGQPSEPATTPQKEVLDDTPIRRFKSMESVFRVSKQNKVFPNTGMNTGTQVQEGCQAAHRQQGNKVSGFGVNGKQRLSVSSDAIDNLELQTRTQTRALADTLALANAHSALSEDKDALQFKGRGSVTAGTNTNMNALGRRATKRLLNRKKSVKVRYADQETNKVALTATVSVQMSATVHFATSQATDTAHPLSVSTLQLNVDSAAPKSTLSTTQTHSPTPTTRVHSEFPSGRRLVRNSIASLCPGQLEKQSGYADEAFFDNPVYTPARRKRSDAQTHTRVYSPPTGNLHPASHANSARNMHTRRETNTRVQAPSSGPRYPLSNCLHAVADPKHRRGNSSRVCAQARSPDKAPVDHRRIEGTVLDEPQMQGMDRLKSRAKSMYSRMNEGEYAAAWTASRYSVGPAGGVGRRRSSESSVSTCEQECGSAEAADTLSWRVNPLQYERMVLVDDSGRPTHTPTPNASPWEPVHASANANSADRDRAHHALDTRFIALPSTDSSASTETVSSQGKASRMSLSMSPPSVRRESVRSVLVDPICLSGDEASDADSADAADAERREGHGYEQAQQTYEDQCGEQPGEHSLQDARALEGAGLDRVRDSETGDADLNATNSEARGIWTNAGQPTRGTGTGVHGDDREMRRNTVNAGAYDESGSESRRVVSDCAQGMAETECRESVAPTPVTPRVIHRDVLDSYVPDNEHGKVSDSLHKANTHSTDNRLVCDVGRGMHNTLDDMPHAPVGKAFSFGSESLMARKDSRGSDNTLDSASRSRDVSITGSRTISLSSASALNNIHSRTSGNSLRASLTNNSRSSTSSSIADKLKHSPDVVGKVTRARSFFECLPTTVSPNPSVLRRERDVQYKTYSHTRAVIESACEDESLILKHRRRTDEDLRSGSGAHSSVRTRVRSYAQPPGETNIARKGSAFTGSGSGVEASLAQAISERQLELLSLSEMVLYSAQTGPSQPPLTQTEATAKMRALMHTQATAIDTLVGLLSQGSA